MMNDKNSLAHTTWNCKYHIVFAPKYSVELQYILDREEKSNKKVEGQSHLGYS